MIWEAHIYLDNGRVFPQFDFGAAIRSRLGCSAKCGPSSGVNVEKTGDQVPRSLILPFCTSVLTHPGEAASEGRLSQLAEMEQHQLRWSDRDAIPDDWIWECDIHELLPKREEVQVGGEACGYQVHMPTLKVAVRDEDIKWGG